MRTGSEKDIEAARRTVENSTDPVVHMALDAADSMVTGGDRDILRLIRGRPRTSFGGRMRGNDSRQSGRGGGSGSRGTSRADRSRRNNNY